MSIKQLSTRIELSFWYTAISLLTDSNAFQVFFTWGYEQVLKIRKSDKKYHTTAWLLTCIAAGISFSMIASIAILVSSTPMSFDGFSSNSHSIPSTNQRNILIIGVDNLNQSNPKLESIWLVMYSLGKSNITFAPVYPGPLEDEAITASILIDNFRLDASGSPEVNFLQLLRQKQIYWNGYILIGKPAISEVTAFLKDFETSEQNQNDGETLISSAFSRENQHLSLYDQTVLINRLCRQASRVPPVADISPILKLVPTHIRTDIKLIDLIHDWRSMSSRENGLNCEFPLLSASIP